MKRALDENEGSWFAAMFHILGLLTATPGGILSSKIGRRKTILLCIPFVIMGWVIIGLSSTKLWLFFGRFITCAFVITYMTSIGAYISETVEPKVRGKNISYSFSALKSKYRRLHQ